MKKGIPIIVIAVISFQCSTIRVGAQESAGKPPKRLFVNSIKDMSEVFQNEQSFHDCLDSMKAYGMNTLRILGRWRMMCNTCEKNLIDINTEPKPNEFDFSTYFDRLDYAINKAGMKIVMTFNLSGKLEGEQLTPGPQGVFPDYIGPDDLMLHRGDSGKDSLYSNAFYKETKVLRFEKPQVRSLILGFVSAVVEQFHQRYRENILYYGFTTSTYDENDYPLVPLQNLCDTSPDAAKAFRVWLTSRYPTPQAVSASWGHLPAFVSFDQIEILDGKPTLRVGQSSQAYLDFMAYREASLGKFLSEIRDSVHAHGGKVLAQYGSVSDASAETRGTFGFGQQIRGFDLVIVDDSPEMNHQFSMDYVRTNSTDVAFGTEVDAPCKLGCASNDIGGCCDASSFPANVDIDLGIARMNDQANQAFSRGGLWIDLANWDAFYRTSFSLFAPSLNNVANLLTNPIAGVRTSDTLRISLKELYVHHHDQLFFEQLNQRHARLGGKIRPVAILLVYDL